MNLKEFAKMLDGREYCHEITRAEEEMAEELGFVVVVGSSDDLIDFYGAIHDEVGSFDGGIDYIRSDGLFKSECDDECCPYAEKERAKCKTIESVWCEGDYSWSYKTDIPHETFDIYRETKKYCRGIVFDIKKLKG